jgi:hypothetical protein
VRRAPSPKFETLSSFAKEISLTGEGVNHVVKRGEVELLERRMRCAKQAKLTHAILSQKIKFQARKTLSCGTETFTTLKHRLVRSKI